MQLLDPADAHAFLQQTPAALFIDCRSEMEHLFVGHPAGSHHAAWNDGPHWEINPEFVPTVRKLSGHGIDRPIVLICRSGNRSAAAAQALEAAGFREVYVVRHGFEGDLDATRHRNTLNGWRHAGLPWEQC
ncbi:rhodanese-like domain-containing protein [Ralstonia solanacearum species complex bacterium KE056]|uniref:rhodanese-like domain-containing protein n=1 Tax=Ralstonia solanacearum species complex TaxID=3116862 RepID=UPI001FFA309C|nr:rhodanese-like domain-containing protein [Ralstonia pseudosolanacearum]